MAERGDDSPQLLEPLRLAPKTPSSRAIPILAAGTLLLALALGLAIFEMNDGEITNQIGWSALGPEHGMFSPVDPTDPRALSNAVGALRLGQAEKETIRAAVEAGTLRLGLLMVWDWMDQDGDLVAVTAAGFVQQVVIGSQPTMIVIPYEHSPVMAVTALQDGCSGCGGVTVAAGSLAQPMNIRALRVGETVTVVLQ